jgi:peptidoglycan/LPS O-acetylase OafA/YrhL
MQYRPDIQALRGLAVSLVVAFHLEFFLLPAGFLGVDIFFAISGYLMASLFNPDDVKGFYTRRAKRLLPGYFATVVVTGLVGIFVVTPNSYGQLSPQLAFASLFASNYGFWLDDSYFAKLSFRPLLHLWSLGVEIQFYLILPVLVYLFKRVRFLFWLVLLGSLGLCFFMVLKSPKTAFLWLPFRVWEFLFGYACFTWHQQLESRCAQYSKLGVLSLVGLCGLAALPIDGIQPSVLWGHPGVAALSAVVLTSVFLVVGLPQPVSDSWPFRVMRKLGDYSYSVYLVHFPLITFLLYEPGSNLSPQTASASLWASTFGLMVVLSIVWFRWVEKLPSWLTLKSSVLGAWAAIAALLVAGSWGQQQWIAANQLPLYQARLDADVFRCGRLWRATHLFEASCLLTPADAQATTQVLLLGNSHADSLKQAFSQVAARKGYAVWFMADNTPMMDYGAVDLEAVMREIERRHVQEVVLHYAPGALPFANLNAFVQRTEEKDIRVKWLAPIPVWPEHVPMMLWRHLNGRGSLATQTTQDYLHANRAELEQVRTLQSPNFSMYEVHGLMCQPDCLLMDESSRPYYRDDAHLSLTGSRLLTPVFESMLAPLTVPSNRMQ